MLETAEVRWFFHGPVPGSLRTWFYNLADYVTLEPMRCDHYLVLTEIDSLGIKVRENRVEVKQRIQARPPTVLAPQISGKVELWRKWSFALSASALELEPVPNEDGWILVCKTRHIQSYTEGVDRPARSAGKATWGYTFELTEITLGSQQWWTLGLEAWEAKSQNQLLDRLHAAIEHTLGPGSPIPLPADASYGYPRWLQLTHQ